MRVRRAHSLSQRGKPCLADVPPLLERHSYHQSSTDLDHLLSALLALDARHEACLLSHVSRRSSKAQGVALLTLFSRGLSQPPASRLRQIARPAMTTQTREASRQRGH